jgi:hypothetical protein
MDEKDLIVTNANELNQMMSVINETFKERDDSLDHWLVWSKACTKFHENYCHLFYPGSYERLQALKKGDADSVETAINFLEVDPVYHRSGYTKEYIWRYIVRCALEPAQLERLQTVALQYTRKRMRREFWYACRAMATLGTDDFWLALAAQMESSDPLIRTRTFYLAAYSDGVAAGERLHLRISGELLLRKYGLTPKVR